MLAETDTAIETGIFEDQFLTGVREQDYFAADRPIFVARAPGRLDVMGGNVDYTGGMVLQSLLREAIWVAVQRRTDGMIRILNPGAAEFGWMPYLQFAETDLLDPESLRGLCHDPGSQWARFVLGALYFLKTFLGSGDLGGADLLIASDLPPNKGVSSSTALEIATLKAAATAWGIRLEGVALATAGQWVENVVAGAACGIMDQAAIVLGQEDSLLPLLCQPCQPHPAIALPAGIRIWGIDSMVARSTTGLAYETARAAAFMGYKLICQRQGIKITRETGATVPRWTDSRWNGYLSNLVASEVRSSFEHSLPESMSGSEFLSTAGEHVDPFTSIHPDIEYPVRAAARYATEENQRVQRVYTLLKGAVGKESARWLKIVGNLLCQSHAAYSECGLGSEACDELVARALRAGFAGAKMTGGGAGGVVAILGRSQDQRRVESVAREFAASSGGVPHLFQGSSAGVDHIGVRTVQLAVAAD